METKQVDNQNSSPVVVLAFPVIEQPTGTHPDQQSKEVVVEGQVVPIGTPIGHGNEYESYRLEKQPEDSQDYLEEAIPKEALNEIFLTAQKFVTVALSRLEHEPKALDTRFWQLHTIANHLWALKQQAIVGSCDEMRGYPEYQYLEQVIETGGYGTGSSWRTCCITRTEDSKIKQWQKLGELDQDTAKQLYVRTLTKSIPNWYEPVHADTALMRPWILDEEVKACVICEEEFTFLNRRHHCRRCSRIVCAVCSPKTIPIRILPGTSPRLHRVCNPCLEEIKASPPPPASPPIPAAIRRLLSTRMTPISTTSTSKSHPTSVATGISATDPVDDPDLVQRASFPYKLSDRIGGGEEEKEKQPSTTQDGGGGGLVPNAIVHGGELELFHGTGFRKLWQKFFVLLLIRKGSLGVFTNAQEQQSGKNPIEVHKLTGYTIRIKSQKKRPHQFRLSHPTKKIMHFSASSIEEMNNWIAVLLKAIDAANSLEEST